jgi:ComF family protein
VAGLAYQFPWDRLIGAYKYAARLDLAGALAERLQAALPADAAGSVDLVTAVPLAAQRLRERGYNQAWELAHRVAAALGVEARPDLVLRLRDTASQAQLHRGDRRANLRGAFMPNPRHRSPLQGRRVALVDDVMTTGATAEEAARTLLRGGASEVHLWLLARTEPPAGSPTRSSHAAPA